MKKYLFSLFCCSVFLSQSLTAQVASTTNSWYMYFGNHRLTDKIGLHTEYQFRRADFVENWQQSLARVGLDYYLPNNMMATAGYAWIVSFPYGEQPIAVQSAEHRIWQQFITNQRLGRVHFNHRYRLEQRFLENATLNAANKKIVDGYRFRQRARYRIFLAVPLNHKKMIDNTLFLAAYEEAFVGFGNGIRSNTIDQNRLYIALGWRFTKDFNVQLGYLNQRIFKADGIRKEYNNGLQVAMTYNMDFRKPNQE